MAPSSRPTPVREGAVAAARSARPARRGPARQGHGKCQGAAGPKLNPAAGLKIPRHRIPAAEGPRIPPSPPPRRRRRMRAAPGRRRRGDLRARPREEAPAGGEGPPGSVPPRGAAVPAAPSLRPRPAAQPRARGRGRDIWAEVTALRSGFQERA